jgi:glycosyltransferase involved in cell wall biosynthesis
MASPPMKPDSVLVHFMHSLEVGGLERVVLDLVRRARSEGLDHRLMICDREVANDGSDFDPGDVPCTFLPRAEGFDVGFIRRLRRFLAHAQARIVHAHNDTPICYAALAGMRRVASTPALIGTFHTLPCHGGAAARTLTRWATRRAAAVTVVSPDLGERLERSGWTRRPRVLENGVQLDLFRPLSASEHARPWHERLRIPREAFVVGCLARFVPGKRQEDLLEAAVILRRNGRNVSLVFAGQGPDRDAFRERARGDVDTHVLDPIEDVPGLLRELDVLVLCSEHEAHPRIVLEALASGVPCVVTNVGGMPGMVGTSREERAGLLVPVAKPEALAEALASLASDRTLRNTLASAARKRAQSFSFEAQWAAYRELWEEVGASRRSQDP